MDTEASWVSSSPLPSQNDNKPDQFSSIFVEQSDTTHRITYTGFFYFIIIIIIIIILFYFILPSQRSLLFIFFVLHCSFTFISAIFSILLISFLPFFFYFYFYFYLFIFIYLFIYLLLLLFYYFKGVILSLLEK